MREFVKHVLGRPYLVRVEKTLHRLELQNRVVLALARVTATRDRRRIDETDPISWEFCGFSQQGEDGILDHLCDRLTDRNEYFVEIGAADGTQNCTAYLAFVRNYSGLMIEGDRERSGSAEGSLQKLNWGVQYIAAYADRENVRSLLRRCPFRNPDVFSLDIDGIDYYVALAMLEAGYRPKVIVAEYNSAFGPERSITVPYRPKYSRYDEHPSGLYYGVSLAGWRTLFGRFGYRFVTVESQGVNAFFIDPVCFQAEFVNGLKGLDFRVNFRDRNAANRPRLDADGELSCPRLEWPDHFRFIDSMPYVEIT